MANNAITLLGELREALHITDKVGNAIVDGKIHLSIPPKLLVELVTHANNSNVDGNGKESTLHSNEDKSNHLLVIGVTADKNGKTDNILTKKTKGRGNLIRGKVKKFHNTIHLDKALTGGTLKGKKPLSSVNH